MYKKVDKTIKWWEVMWWWEFDKNSSWAENKNPGV
jgi:hypothetical protein